MAIFALTALVGAALLACVSSQALGAETSNRQSERDLFAEIVEIPTVKGRTAEFKKLTGLLTAEFRKVGITNVVVKDHDGTQTLIARWPAAKPSGKKPILLMAHMDFQNMSRLLASLHLGADVESALVDPLGELLASSPGDLETVNGSNGRPAAFIVRQNRPLIVRATEGLDATAGLNVVLTARGSLPVERIEARTGQVRVAAEEGIVRALGATGTAVRP